MLGIWTMVLPLVRLMPSSDLSTTLAYRWIWPIVKFSSLRCRLPGLPSLMTCCVSMLRGLTYWGRLLVKMATFVLSFVRKIEAISCFHNRWRCLAFFSAFCWGYWSLVIFIWDDFEGCVWAGFGFSEGILGTFAEHFCILRRNVLS